VRVEDRIREAAVEQLTAELDGAEAERAERRDEGVPVTVAFPEGAVHRRRLALDAERPACEGDVPRDNRRRLGRRLEHEPAVIADLRKRCGALGEVDAADARVAVVLPREQILHVHPADELTELAHLGRRIQAADERVGEIEVAAEGGGVDALGQRADARGRQRPLVREHDAARCRVPAQLAKRRRRALERSVVAELRLDEERDQDRADAELGRPRDRDADVLGRRRDRPGVARGDAAQVVLVEHEGRDLEPGRGLCSAEPGRRAAVAEVPPQEDHLDAEAPDRPGALESVEFVATADHVVQDADLHRSASSTGAPMRADS
jgi:hypothetical protein